MSKKTTSCGTVHRKSTKKQQKATIQSTEKLQESKANAREMLQDFSEMPKNVIYNLYRHFSFPYLC
jgi:hypothetical protein